MKCEARNFREFHGAFHLRVRGENLLEKSRSGPRQSDNEYRIGSSATDPLSRGKKFRIADCFLPRRRALDGLDVVAAFILLEFVAALVIREGLRESKPVLERFSKGKAQVVSIRERGGRGRLVRAHARNLVVREQISLEVRKAPVRIAEARLRGRRVPVGIDCLGPPTQGLQSMVD